VFGEGDVPLSLPNNQHLIHGLAIGNEPIEIGTVPFAFGASPMGAAFLNYPNYLTHVVIFLKV
jgi:hypothetical protein